MHWMSWFTIPMSTWVWVGIGFVVLVAASFLILKPGVDTSEKGV